MISIVRLEAPLTPDFLDMTFPAYRDYLSHPSGEFNHPDIGAISTFALGAVINGQAIGLIFATIPMTRGTLLCPELLSVFVATSHRRQGVASLLMAKLGSEIRALGFSRLTVIYFTGHLELENWFNRCGWSQPEIQGIAAQFNPKGITKDPLWGHQKVRKDYAIFPWRELREDDYSALKKSNLLHEWIPSILVPWQYDCDPRFDKDSSFGLRYKSQIVGWQLNHRLSPNTVRFTCGFVREDLARLGRLVLLWQSSICFLLEKDPDITITFASYLQTPQMVAFVRRRMGPWIPLLRESIFREYCFPSN